MTRTVNSGRGGPDWKPPGKPVIPNIVVRPRLPDYPFRDDDGQPGSVQINRAGPRSPTEVRFGLVAADRPIPVVFGSRKVQGRPIVLADGSDARWFIGWGFAQGEANDITAVIVDDVETPVLLTTNPQTVGQFGRLYTGASGQDVSGYVSTYIPGYTDTLDELVCYFHRFLPEDLSGEPLVWFRMEGQKDIYDPRDMRSIQANASANSGDVFQVADHANLKPTDLTIEGWAIVDSGQSAQIRDILRKLSGSAGYRLSLQHTTYSDQPICQLYVDGNSKVLSAPAGTIDPLDGEPHHIAMTYDASAQEHRLYVDGALVAEATYTESTGNISHDTQALNFNVLGTNWGVRDLRVWNVVRTPEQIRDNYRAHLEGNETGLVGYWPVDDAASATTVLDKTSNNHDATIVGTDVTVDAEHVVGLAPASWSNRAYSVNPALCGGRLIEMASTPTNPIAPNWHKLGIVADHNDELISGSPRHTLNMVCDEDKDWREWFDYIASAGSFVWWEEAGEILMTPDWVESSSLTITDADVVPESLLQIVGDPQYDERPDNTIVTYYDPTEEVDVQVPAVAITGNERTIDYRNSFGTDNHEEAKRMAVTVQNRHLSEPTLLQLDVFDVGIRIQKWDVITFNLASKGINADFRIVKPPELLELGVWRLLARVYSASTYDTSAVAGSAINTITVANASDIPTGPTPTNVEVFNFSADVLRVYVDFVESAFPHTKAVMVEILNNGETEQLVAPVERRIPTLEELAAGPPRTLRAIVEVPAELNDFKARLAIRNTLGKVGAYGTATQVDPIVLPTPGAVSNISAEVLGQSLVGETDAVRIRLSWNPPDYYTWLGYEVEIRRAKIEDVANRSVTTLTSIEKIATATSAGAPFVDLDLAAPGEESESGSGGYQSTAYMYHLLVRAYNAAGTFGAQTSYAHGDSLTHGGTLIPVGISGTSPGSGLTNLFGGISFSAWDSAIDNGDGTITLNWYIYLENGHNFDYGYGFRINVYDSNGSNVKGDLLEQKFIHISPVGYRSNVNNPGTSDETLQFGSDPGDDLILSFQDTFTIVKEVSGHRRFTIQLLGPGDEAGDEDDMVEGNLSGPGPNPTGGGEEYAMPTS